MQISWNTRECLQKRRVQSTPTGLVGTPTRPPFHCFGTPIWLPWRHVKTPRSNQLTCVPDIYARCWLYSTVDKNFLELLRWRPGFGFLAGSFHFWPSLEMDLQSSSFGADEISAPKPTRRVGFHLPWRTSGLVSLTKPYVFWNWF